ncbi:hypothetical protein PsorP6_000053 [Peronosclerospora sorghi]|uniref:Uncharacterized protein n=1 Tax=Peronosclerospora sorghi TaxID=230839 RepID=A0ACC0WT19_9STRA|nr:hypothetical protein PsorP6_000053 [Peronosclerospora sorghi]
MRLSAAVSPREKEFAKWILEVANGTVPAVTVDVDTEKDWIEIPPNLLLPSSSQRYLASLVAAVYPALEANAGNPSYIK